MSPSRFLLLNLALAFYNVGTIWAHELDIFRSWKLVDTDAFHRVQFAHWSKLPYWVLAPVALALAGAIGLLWYRPQGPIWVVWGALACQLTSHAGTGLFWARWQAKLSKDELGSKSPYLTKILATHWIRTALVNAYAVILLVWLAGLPGLR